MVGRNRMLPFMIAVILMFGCGTAGAGSRPGEFAKLMIESYPRGWGYAYKTVGEDATITGGHLSGGPDAPMVYEAKSMVTAQDMSELRSLVAILGTEVPNGEFTRPDQKVNGYTSVVIIYHNGSTATLFARWGGKFHSKAVQSIWEIISKYQVGAW